MEKRGDPGAHSGPGVPPDSGVKPNPRSAAAGQGSRAGRGPLLVSRPTASLRAAWGLQGPERRHGKLPRVAAVAAAAPRVRPRPAHHEPIASRPHGAKAAAAVTSPPRLRVPWVRTPVRPAPSVTRSRATALGALCAPPPPPAPGNHRACTGSMVSPSPECSRCNVAGRMWPSHTVSFRLATRS